MGYKTEKFKYLVNILCLLLADGAKQRQQKEFTCVLSAIDLVDVMYVKEKKKIVKFALNYRSFIAGEWREVYRVDNFHGFLHEQRFWRSPHPIPLKDDLTMNSIFTKYLKLIKENYTKYRAYFQNARKD